MRILLRASGASAILGGVLRIADSFTVLPQSTFALLYLVTDAFLLAGVAGLWVRRRARIGLAGTVGLAVFVAGIAMVRASALGVGSYRTGATVALLGLAIYALETLFRGAPWAPAAWLGSLAFGIAGTAGFAPSTMTALAGVLFGLGFVAAGIETLYGAPQSAHTATSTVT